MSDFINNLLNLCLVPFKDDQYILMAVAGMLVVSWCFRTVYNMVRGSY